MSAWETEDEYAIAAQASLPTPADTPYRTPSRGSRRSSRQKSKSPGPSSSPLPLPSGDRQGSNDVTNDESISILDPRRFTPTLHANLVSEILALRRDQEENVRIVENLEADLHNARGEHEVLEASLAETSKENRALKRELALLEGGTSTAITDIARERDNAVESSVESKRRIESLQKKMRSQKEDSDRAHALWARDRDMWEEERRTLERKAHVAETRLKTVLDEVATYQAQIIGHVQHESEEGSRDPVNGHGSDATSIRTMSITNSIRFSMLNGPNGYGGAKINGVSLADELGLDEEDDDTDHEGRESALSLRHERNHSREGILSKGHRRDQSLESLARSGSVAKRILAQQAVLERLEGGIMEDDETGLVPVKKEYSDASVQCSPPPSPQLSAVELVSVTEILPVNGSGAVRIEQLPEAVPRECEIEANQRRKRVHATPALVIDTPETTIMVSSASQTQEHPLSPPRTPISPTRAPPPPPVVVPVREMTSISTQTDVPEIQSPPSLRRASPPLPPIEIPSIQLHPPNSTPGTPHEPLLPQHSKDAGCQVAMQVPIPTRSISVQTEEIRVARRMNLLPTHLQPCSISSNPPSPEPDEDSPRNRFSSVPENLPPRNPLRKLGRPSLEQEIPSSPPLPAETRDVYPGNNDDGPLPMRRPRRISSLFAGFENVSSDDGDEFADADLSDNDYRTALSAPRHKAGVHRLSKRVSSIPTVTGSETVDQAEVSRPFRGNDPHHIANERDGESSFPKVQELPSRTTKASVRQIDKPLALVANNKSTTMRRAALIQSGVFAHQGRSRSPSLPEEAITAPPFPIPTRASSRRTPISTSAPSDGSRSPTWGRGSGSSRGGHYRANSIRKVRSAAALPGGRGSHRRQDSQSSPPMSASTEAPESPRLPPMPSNDVTTPQYMRDRGSSRQRAHRRQQPSINTAITTNTINTCTASVATTSNATSVVDAIAQTMVGEWMFKYVRRRKSFGVSEPAGFEGENTTGVRHKRWVWLAPYERAVMWSSKQPTSGSALMGKTGRKLTIQSVLDVKDDNAPPRGSAPLFNRSVLILTPARALKFTATTPERHYIWLTALSFLAHSAQAIPEIVQSPLPLPRSAGPESEMPAQNDRLTKGGIRDSIRVAKSKKTVVAQYGPTSVHSSHRDNSFRETESIYSHSDPIQPEVSAEPPVVLRFSERGQGRGGGGGVFNFPSVPTHSRKRSNTGGRIPPPLSFRGFSGPTSSHEAQSITTSMSVAIPGSADIFPSQTSSLAGGQAHTSASGRSSSARTSDASSRPGAVVNNFFDAVGTMRMEAFISPMALSRFDDFPDEQDEMDMAIPCRRRRRSSDIKGRRRLSRNTDSIYSAKGGRPSDEFDGGGGGIGHKTAGEEDYGHFDGGFGIDPFRGF
ncbi:uncharacterized protein L3040_005502 [Drepanopeziza brunnea f. sp. 'multigermtubi']|uniref:Nuclear migration protein n=1 Tax=Marssonina brunnea f. sp. multigermtubi (strain MB_m1) TaxID=1072389 RepID=K1W9F6_MARBU|nr:nuclear migration protein [Drepanopeziza brunnea f. sp. 'multigermtubi' MB_m1]EKD13885.1 nuclear migration protein [Drepanopeziza brunnea f. sp. 'multigermtubi' MB_m1]KAJ5040943.1 hypothetical protein L3040_005502 [Drepanopeziza brunnea f. sp. 'multigermtubi']